MNVDCDGTPAREEGDVEQSGNGSSPRRSRTSDRRRGGRRVLGRMTWVGVERSMLWLRNKFHVGACREASVVLGAGG